jgi:hypothetical protein
MANVKPVPLNPSQALITPGWPMAQVAQSNPVADQQLKEGTTTNPSASTALKTAHTQSGHTADRID